LRPEAAREAGGMTSNVPADATATVLIVEDDEDTREVLRDICEDIGYGVATACDGAAALAWLGSNDPPCVVILDRVMPKLDGRELLEVIHTHPGLEKIPVVLVSAAENADIPRTLLYKNGGGELKKPVHLEDLLERIEQHCG
jgi:CheY-like chemotaxis protein